MAIATRKKRVARKTLTRSSRTRRKPAGPKRASSPGGGAAVRRYILSLPAGQRELARAFDATVGKLVPGIVRTIKWGIPFYGRKGQGWILSCMGRAPGVRITFFQGIALKPRPPICGRQAGGLDVVEAKGLKSARLTSWIRQAAGLPGYAPNSC